MTLHYQIKPLEKMAEVMGHGISDFPVFMMTMRQLAADPHYCSSYDVIADFRQVNYLPSFGELRKLASEFGQLRTAFKGRVAIVVKNGGQLKLGRFAQILAQMIDFELSVFQDPHLALHWLREREVHEMSALKAKIFSVLGPTQLAALGTVTPEGKPWVRYVMTAATRDLTVRFATVKGSRKIAEIRDNPRVHLLTGVSVLAEAERWVQVEGRAEISAAQEERFGFWHDGLKAYFESPEDPNYVICVIRPTRIEYMSMSAMKPEVWEAGSD
jgi:general stress protein 26